MKTLPSTFPRWLILLLNLLVLGVMVGLGAILKQIDVRYLFGFLVGFFLMYVSVRLKYGFWPFND